MYVTFSKQPKSINKSTWSEGTFFSRFILWFCNINDRDKWNQLDTIIIFLFLLEVLLEVLFLLTKYDQLCSILCCRCVSFFFIKRKIFQVFFYFIFSSVESWRYLFFILMICTYICSKISIFGVNVFVVEYQFEHILVWRQKNNAKWKTFGIVKKANLHKIHLVIVSISLYI